MMSYLGVDVVCSDKLEHGDWDTLKSEAVESRIQTDF